LEPPNSRPQFSATFNLPSDLFNNSSLMVSFTYQFSTRPDQPRRSRRGKRRQLEKRGERPARRSSFILFVSGTLGWPKRSVIAYWLAPYLKEHIFITLETFATAHQLPLLIQRYHVAESRTAPKPVG
jgi:hypothetical protein